jgi:anti-sigma regulatory factor (Ser/Thr protein kinase)/GNAT superfamily N-acetyltransferase
VREQSQERIPSGPNPRSQVSRKQSRIKPSVPINSRLTIPADIRFLSMAQSWGREMEALANSDPRDGLSLELAVEEGFTNAAQHAYPDGQPGPVHLEGSVDGNEFTVSIRDEGVPYCPTSVPTQPRCTHVFGGVGLKLISHAADEVRFINHGRAGKELRLVRYLVEEIQATPEQVSSEIPRAPEQEYEIRKMRPEEALQVARVFWHSYGYSYKNDNFYRPEGLLHLIGTGKAISFVAVAENGEVIGHAGLLRPEPVPSAEAALLVVSPAHRGRGLMEKLADAQVSAAKEMGLYGLTVNPVTSHPVSQRETVRNGGAVCGLDLGACSPRTFKAIIDDEVPPQRESYLSCFLNLSPPPPASIYVPQRHRDIVAQIYEALGRELTILEEGAIESQGSFSVTFDRPQAKGTIRVLGADPEGWGEILRTADNLTDIGSAEVVNLDLPLSQPGTRKIWEFAESAGFFFAGVRPFEAADGDNVRLQRLSIPFDMDRLRIYPKFGRELLAYVTAERDRANSEPS